MNELVEKKSPEVLAAEIRALTASMLANIIEIGRRMCQAKEILPHGQFGEWVKTKTGYSQSTANNFMKLFQEYGAPQESLFGAEVNSQTFGNLPYSKALALLAVPAEEREDFVRDNHVEEMSTRELQQAIKERDELRRQLDEEREAAEGAGLKIADLEEKLEASSREAARQKQIVEQTKEELEALKNAPVEMAIQAADPEEVQRAVEEAQREVGRLKKELAMADPVVAEFKGLFEQASGLVAKLLGLVDCAPKDKQGNLRNALAALGKQMVV